MTAGIPAYLDYCASAPIKRGVWEVTSALMRQTGNASSVHGFGRSQRQRVDMAREEFARRFGVKSSQVIFTSGATESNNTILKAFPDYPVIVSSIEHPSILNVAPEAAQIRVNRDGRVDLNHLEHLLQVLPQPALVCLMLVNNETGVIQPVMEAAKLCKNYGALLHCDAVAAVGRMLFNFNELGADSLSLCAHKIGGPQGAGALILRAGLTIRPFIRGGGQEMHRRAGTENVAAIAGFSEALRFVDEDLERGPLWLSWRESFESMIMQAAPEAVIFGQGTARVPTISAIAMPGVSHEMQLMAFDLEGFAVSAGSACSSGKIQPSHVLNAMGTGPLAGETIRVSFGWATRKEELENFASSWISVYRRQRPAKVA
ncbi:MAG: cysteine desulfurase [Proteobacteria bacterium]|nr:cysteine desulfurase [Pseudomonadota bacterium]